MRTIIRATLLFAFSLLLTSVAYGQTPTTTIENGNGDTRLQLNADGGFYIPGTYVDDGTENDSIPAEGAGTRLMWYPAKAAFRAGEITDPGGSEWNASNVGHHSFAVGYDTEASAFASTAIGQHATASASHAFAIGNASTASGVFGSIAMGNYATASGAYGAFAVGDRATASGTASLSSGRETEASGQFAVAMGVSTIATSDHSVSIGSYNSANTSSDASLLVAGNGSSGSRADAMVLKRDGDLAVGPSDPEDLRLYVAKDKGNAGVGDSPKANMVLFENTSSGSKPDVLGLQAGPQNPGSGVTYVSFYDGSGTTVGTVEGNGSGGVNYTSAGADFAEELPVATGASRPEAGDLVAVRGGQVKLNTNGADRLMIVSDQAAMTGNVKPDASGDRVPVAFIGQVPVKVRGTVSVGDLLVASGQADGTARAVAPEAYRMDEHGPVAGRAWAKKATEGTGTVVAAVGMGHETALERRFQTKLQKKQSQLDALKAENAAIQQRLNALEEQVEAPTPDLAGMMGPWGVAMLLACAVGGIGGLLLSRRTERVPQARS
ncbi:hypothetical protein CRI94_10950 [Longibacter salinarum]|uniref:Trimeric autotransporter adhesin YadA-like head domain-containing protein n=1 Tax=Longibacter salinarum TaxID=1850348 RepID=A0A2A8CX60_9BACT|nr:hypothetical protein [Longibacter salinarum]PEN13157.1 hypothetical protein CRI94_10950 [Longibacter salinarum]